MEEREKGTLEYCLIILLLSNIRDGFFMLTFMDQCSPPHMRAKVVWEVWGASASRNM